MTNLQRWIDSHKPAIAVASFFFFLFVGLGMIYGDYAMGINEFNHWLY